MPNAAETGARVFRCAGAGPEIFFMNTYGFCRTCLFCRSGSGNTALETIASGRAKLIDARVKARLAGAPELAPATVEDVVSGELFFCEARAPEIDPQTGLARFPRLKPAAVFKKQCGCGEWQSAAESDTTDDGEQTP